MTSLLFTRIDEAVKGHGSSAEACKDWGQIQGGKVEIHVILGREHTIIDQPFAKSDKGVGTAQSDSDVICIEFSFFFRVALRNDRVLQASVYRRHNNQNDHSNTCPSTASLLSYEPSGKNLARQLELCSSNTICTGHNKPQKPTLGCCSSFSVKFRWAKGRYLH